MLNCYFKYYSMFSPPRRVPGLGMDAALALVSTVETMMGSELFLMVDTRDKCSMFLASADRDFVPLGNFGINGDDDCWLAWFEQHVRRLSEDIYRIDKEYGGICLFPWSSNGDESLRDCVSRRVTKGVEVIASSIFITQNFMDGFIYCLRIRILEEGEEGYLSAEQRGFDACRLRTRHWRIFDRATNNTQTVNGEGVVGMYPTLMEGGFMERKKNGGQFTQGYFSYQSCTGPMEDGGQFGGHLVFQMIRIQNNDTATFAGEFEVEVGTIELNKKRNFLY